jgi:hypothetical protein
MVRAVLFDFNRQDCKPEPSWPLHTPVEPLNYGQRAVWSESMGGDFMDRDGLPGLASVSRPQLGKKALSYGGEFLCRDGAHAFVSVTEPSPNPAGFFKQQPPRRLDDGCTEPRWRALSL